MKNSISFQSNLTKFGIGVFETIKVNKGKAIFLDEHLKRMYNSIKELDIPFQITRMKLKEEIINYIKNEEHKALRITICDEGYHFALRDIHYKKQDYEKGYKIKIAPIKRGTSFIYKHKTTNYLENMYSKKYALDHGCEESLFLNMKNKILEGSMTNIFFMREEKIYTPKEDLCILPGIVRNEVIKVARNLGVEVIEDEIDINELNKFNFSFITNSLMNMMKISAIEDVVYNEENDIFNHINLKLEELCI